MGQKLIYNFSDTPTWSKVLPLVGLSLGVGLAKYQKKDCIGCYLGYGLSGLLIASVPLLYKAKEAVTPKMLEDCGCGGK